MGHPRRQTLVTTRSGLGQAAQFLGLACMTAFAAIVALPGTGAPAASASPRITAAATSGADIGSLLPLAALPSVATAAGHTSHTIAGAPTLHLGQTAHGGGSKADFWRAPLAGGDVVQFQVNEPKSGGNSYEFELYAPGTTDTSFPQATAMVAAATNGNSTDVIELQVPFNGTFVLAVCENTHPCTSVETGSGVSPMGAYSFLPTLVSGSPSPHAAARETVPSSTIAGARHIALGALEAGGGTHIDFWRVTLAGGDVLEFTITQPNDTNPGSCCTGPGYNYQLYAPGTTDTSFASAAPLSVASSSGDSTQGVITVQAPFNGTFILAVCINASPCGTVDSGSGWDPMGPYTFRTSLVGGGIPPRVAARETLPSSAIAGAGEAGVGDVEAGGGTHIDFWRMALVGGDKVLFNVTQPNNTPAGACCTGPGYNYELYRPGTTDTSFPSATPVATTTTSGDSTSSIVTLQAPYTGNFVLAVCEAASPCSTVDKGSGSNPMGEYFFHSSLIGGPPLMAQTGAFRIVRLKPSTANSVLNGPHKALTVQWAGHATFPVTLYDIPTPQCSTSAFTCEAGSQSFKRGTHALVWPGAVSCTGSTPLTAPHVGTWDIEMVDATHHHSALVPLVMTCRPSA